jgi:diguanylate cyclase (GGDEF)-like protein
MAARAPLVPILPELPQLLGLAGSTTATAALGLAYLPPIFAAGITLGWTLLGVRKFGPKALATGLPLIGLLDGGHWSTLVAWGCAGAGLTTAIGLVQAAQLRERTRDLRRDLRLAERDSIQLREIIARYPALQEACLALSAVRDMDQLATVLCHQVHQLVPSARRIRVHVGLASQLACRASLDTDGQPCGREPGDDECYVATEARVLTRRDGDFLQVLMPLRGERRAEHGREVLCGVLDAAMPPDASDEHLRIELLRALAQLGGIGLAAVDLVGQARALALRDDLTGLFGQHEFLRRLDEQVASARRHGHGLGVIMCDLDHLKRFNDTWGHAAGDEALQIVAKAIARVAQEVPGGIACRYGGEEFALCLPDRSDAALSAVAERLRIDIASSMPGAGHPQRRVTASIGAASLRQPENGRAVLIRADAACYRAKSQGRDRVSLADDLGTVDAPTRILPALGNPLLPTDNTSIRTANLGQGS